MKIITLNDLLIALSILAILLGALLWIIKAQVSQIKHETSPNSGGSMKDKIDLTHELVREEAKSRREWREEQAAHNERLYASIGNMHKRMDEHVHDHLVNSSGQT